MTLQHDDPYAVLGLPRGATRVQAARAYRALARQLHPDTNPDPAAAEQLARVMSAHQRLATTPTPTPQRPTPTPTPPRILPTPARSHRPRGATLLAGPVRIRPLPR